MAHATSDSRHGWLAIVALGVLLAAGCRPWDRPPSTEPAPWTKNLRSPDPNLNPFGASSQARQIERNLGVE